MLFKNATIYTMEQDPFVGDFRIDKGVFTEIGKDLNPKDEEVQDLNGLYSTRFKWTLRISWTH